MREPCMFWRAKPLFDDEVGAILARLRRARVIGSDETTVRVNGRTHWNWVFQNDEVVIHVIRPSRGRAVVAEVLGGHRPDIWVSDAPPAAGRGSRQEYGTLCVAACRGSFAPIMPAHTRNSRQVRKGPLP